MWVRLCRARPHASCCRRRCHPHRPGARSSAPLVEVQLELRALIELRPDVVAIERVLFQHNVSTAMGVGMVSGLAMAEAVAAGCDVSSTRPTRSSKRSPAPGRPASTRSARWCGRSSACPTCCPRSMPLMPPPWRCATLPGFPAAVPERPSPPPRKRVRHDRFVAWSSARPWARRRTSNEVGGVGHRVQVTPSTSVTIGELDGDVFVHTHHAVREDWRPLWLRHHRRTASLRVVDLGHGVGPALGLAILSVYGPDACVAVAEDDVAALCPVPGVGKKTAARL